LSMSLWSSEYATTGAWKNPAPVGGDTPRLGVIVQSVVGDSL